MKTRTGRWWPMVGVVLLLSILASTGQGLGSAPQITAIDFPKAIQADGNPVTGYIFFSDRDGDVAKAKFELVEGDQEALQLTPGWEFDPGVKGETEDVIGFQIAATAAGQFTLQVILTDEAGNQSEPYRFSFTALAAKMLGYIPAPNNLYIVDLSAGELLQTISAPFDSPDGAEFSLDKSTLYIYNSSREREGEVFLFDVKGRAFKGSIAVGGHPNDLEIAPSGNLAYLNNFSLHEVQVIDLATNEVKSTIPIEGTPNEIALSPDGRRAYVTAFNYDEKPPYTPAPLFVLDLAQEEVTGSIPLQYDGEDYVTSSVDITPDGKTVYVLALNTTGERWAVFIIDAQNEEVIQSVPLDVPLANVLVIAPDGQSVYISAFFDGVLRIDPEHPTEVQKIALQGEELANAYLIAFSPDSKTAYVIGRNDPERKFRGPGFVAAIDAKTGQQLDLDGDPGNGLTNLHIDEQGFWLLAIPGGKGS